jgi:deoxyribodipyrimidine photo-lyase
MNNNTLIEALKQCDKVYPMFIFNPEQVGKQNKYRSARAIKFMVECLEDLYINTARTLSIYEHSIKSIIKSVHPSAIYMNRDMTPYAVKRDTEIWEYCHSLHIDVFIGDDILLKPVIPTILKVEKPEDFKQLETKVYQKFTPYYTQHHDSPPAPSNPSYTFMNKLSKCPIKSMTIQQMRDKYVENVYSDLEGGRKNALIRWKKWKPSKAMGDTSKMSAYIKFGCVSPRELVKTAEYRRSLVWRDFYHRLTLAFPHVLQGQIKGHNKALKPKYDNIKWNHKHLEAWKSGTTGVPIVDAAMRELLLSGFMDNRARLITSSFLIKTLGIDWREGELWFAQQLVDYDPINNNGNWQWMAGSGADAQPYFRILNPWLQSERHDKNADYIKKWIPELENIPANHIHKWYKYGDKSIYPLPIVSYEEQRDAIIEMYKKIYRN